MDLPQLSDDEQALSSSLRQRIAERIDAAGGALPFDRYMESALYEPTLGYYVNGRHKFGESGDFTTAPEVSPLFGQCIAQQLAECLSRIDGGDVLEIGAGSGRLAVDVLCALRVDDALPRRYLILELSPDLVALQRETLRREAPDLLDSVHWLQALPDDGFRGVVLGNEVLDAMPVQRFRRAHGAWQELAVGQGAEGFEDRWQAPFTPGIEAALENLWRRDAIPPDGYTSEINLRVKPWLGALAACLERGYMLLIDYGYSHVEYYHAERSMGTLVCHFRHRVHADPYLLPGLQDITASVDFSAVAEAAQRSGMDVCGYTTQAHFLIGSGLDRRVAASDPNDLRRHMALMQQVKWLTLPSEMGERFKVIALARNAPTTLSGFQTKELRDRL